VKKTAEIMEKREKWTVGDKIVKKEVESRRGKKRS